LGSPPFFHPLLKRPQIFQDVHHVNALPKLGDIPVIFGIFSKCFAQNSF
jgi:hypothetical protein